MFTILDGDLPSGRALIRLSNAQNFYVEPSQGEPTPQTFVDDEASRQADSLGKARSYELDIFRFKALPSPTRSVE